MRGQVRSVVPVAMLVGITVLLIPSVVLWGWCDCQNQCVPCSLESLLSSRKNVEAALRSRPPRPAEGKLPIRCEGPQPLEYVDGGPTYSVIKLTIGTDYIQRCFDRDDGGAGTSGEYKSTCLLTAGPVNYLIGGGDSTYVWEAATGYTVHFNSSGDLTDIKGPSGESMWKDVTWTLGDLISLIQNGVLVQQEYGSGILVQTMTRDGVTVQESYWHYTYSGATLVRQRTTVVTYNSDGSKRLETTIWGFWGEGEGDKSGLLRYVVNGDGVVRYLSANPGKTGIDPTDPGAACDLDDTGAVTDAALEAYASAKYLNYDAEGRILQETNSCASCGGGGFGTTTYVYSDPDANPAYPATPTAEQLYNVWKTWIRQTDPSGRRQVQFLNAYGQVLTTVAQEMSGTTITNRWISDQILDTEGHVTEDRSPAACTVYAPTTGAGADAGWTTDPGRTSTGTVGLVTLSGYDDNDNLLWTKVRQGVTDNDAIEYYQQKLTYTSVTYDEATVWRVETSTRYPSQTTDADASDREVTTFNYTYFQDGEGADTTAVEYAETVYPVVTTDRNGSGVASRMTAHFYQDEDLQLYYNDWTRHEDGTLSYAQQNDFSQTVKTITDVDTTQTGEFTGLPAGWSHAGGLNLISTMAYDIYGRTATSTDPGGRTTGYAYTCQRLVDSPTDETTTSLVTLVTPEVDENGNFGYAPASISISDMAGHGIQSATGMPTTRTGNLYAAWDMDQTSIQSAFAGTLYTWSVSTYNDNQQLTSSDAYFLIPASGSGAEGTNYYRTSYAYNATTGWMQSTTGPTGSIGWTQFDQLGRAYASWIGTDATGATNDDPSNGGAGGNNMKRVSQSFFDEATPGSGTSGVGDGYVTSTRAYYDATDAGQYVLTIYRIDYRGRTRGIEPETAPYSVSDVDNMGRTVAAALYQANVTWATVLTDEDYAATVAGDATTGAKRGSLSMSLYDQMGRSYRSETYAVDPTTGAAGDKLVSDSYYDASGRLAGSTSPGNGGMELAYDGAGRQTESRQVVALKDDKYEGGAYAYRLPLPGATSGGNDGVIQISRTVYDNASNAIKSITLQVNHDDADGIDLTAGHEDYVQSATFSWVDEVYRPIGTAYYGSGDAGNQWKYAPLPARAAAPPAASSAGVLVTRTAYADSGRVDSTTDAKGHVSKPFYDDLGRTTAQVNNYKAGSAYWTSEPLSPKARDADVNQIVAFTYDGASNVLTQTAVDPNYDGSTADNQVTTYTYAFDYNPSAATKVQYPDSADSSWDVVSMTYALDGQIATRTSQKAVVGDTANVVTFSYDDTLRRPTKQAVTTPGTGVDTSVLAIGTSYDSLGRSEKLTSYDDASAETAGHVVNQNQFVFDDMGMLDKEYQSHHGAVDTGTTPYVQYNRDPATVAGAYTKGLRTSSVRYPNGRLEHYGYGASGSRDEMISRVATINDDQQALGGGTPGLPGQAVTSYAYNGAGMIVQENYPVPGVKLDYAGPTPGTYAGFDRFARVVDQRWARVPSPSQGEGQGEGSSVDRFAYGYDYNSNRTWRANKVKTAGQDWSYSNDALDRLVDGDRGTLQANPDNGLIVTSYKQNWGLDQAGNWPTFKWDPTGSAGWTTQSRTHDKANEILTITGTGAAWPDPAYDARGNMTFGPKPSDTSVGIHMTWDAWNRLVKVQADSGGSPGSTIAEYQYDGANRRLVKLIPDGANWDRTDFYYNTNWQILEERYDAGLADKVTVATTVHVQYVWSQRYIDAPVLRDRDTVAGGDLGKAASGLDERLYYTNDANMNVTSLVDVNGAVVERYDYTPYGVVTIYDGTWTDIRTASLFDNQVLYCGYRFDPETELYQVRNRYYHAPLGRWISRDPLALLGLINSLCFGSDTPANTTDPLGMQEARKLPTYNNWDTLPAGERPYDALTPFLVDRYLGQLRARVQEFTRFCQDKYEPSFGATELVMHVTKVSKAAVTQLNAPRGSGARMVYTLRITRKVIRYNAGKPEEVSYTSTKTTHEVLPEAIAIEWAHLQYEVYWTYVCECPAPKPLDWLSNRPSNGRQPATTQPEHIRHTDERFPPEKGRTLVINSTRQGYGHNPAHQWQYALAMSTLNELAEKEAEAMKKKDKTIVGVEVESTGYLHEAGPSGVPRGQYPSAPSGWYEKVVKDERR
ncbi:MAG: hypothetical protein BIFFINMI_02809 [Phycisphaerae bacterium]|nr:hypothetical protein [Phycisphaerae bacterium]